MLFFLWGIVIAAASITKFVSGETIPINNDFYEEIEMFKVPGVEVYAHQFPINLVSTPEELVPIIKQIKAWDKRTGEL